LRFTFADWVKTTISILDRGSKTPDLSNIKTVLPLI